MDVIEWYAVALGGTILLPILTCVLFFVFGHLQVGLKRYCLRYLLYPQIHRYIRASWSDLAILLIFIVANTIATAINVRNVAGFVKRIGLISVVNIVPQFLGGRLNIVLNQCGIGLKAYTRMHRWLGRVAIVQGLIHVIAALANHQRPDLKTRSDIAAVVVSKFNSRQR